MGPVHLGTGPHRFVSFLPCFPADMAPRPRAAHAAEILLAALTATVVASCGQGTAPPTPKPVAAVTVAENLSFSGVLSGAMSSGGAALPLTRDEPPAEYTFGTDPPVATRCYDFQYRVGEQHPIHVYEAVVAGKVGAHDVGLVLLVEPVQRTVVGLHRITGDNTPSFPGQGLGYLWVDGQFWRYPAAAPTSTVVVAADGLSGTATFQVGNAPGGGASEQSIAVSGGWRCGPATR